MRDPRSRAAPHPAPPSCLSRDACVETSPGAACCAIALPTTAAHASATRTPVCLHATRQRPKSARHASETTGAERTPGGEAAQAGREEERRREAIATAHTSPCRSRCSPPVASRARRQTTAAIAQCSRARCSASLPPAPHSLNPPATAALSTLLVLRSPLYPSPPSLSRSLALSLRRPFPCPPASAGRATAPAQLVASCACRAAASTSRTGADARAWGERGPRAEGAAAVAGAAACSSGAGPTTARGRTGRAARCQSSCGTCTPTRSIDGCNNR